MGIITEVYDAERIFLLVYGKGNVVDNVINIIGNDSLLVYRLNYFLLATEKNHLAKTNYYY